MAWVDYVSGRDTVSGTLTSCESLYEMSSATVYDFRMSIIDLSSDADLGKSLKDIDQESLRMKGVGSLSEACRQD